MPLLNALELPPPRNWQDFEDLCCDLWRRLWGDPDAQKNGRSGQPQAGVDVFGRPNRGIEWTGIQCKLKSPFAGDRLTQEEIEEAAAKARSFKPALSSFIVATTVVRDAKVQEVARNLTERGPISVTVTSWTDIVESLAEYPDLVAKHFPQFHLATGLVHDTPRLAPPLHLDSETEPALERMRRNLDLLAVDVQVPTDLFFDSRDVYAMILGLEGFARRDDSDSHFWSLGTLVGCIAAAGWYPTIKLLPMHQQELLQLLGREFGRSSPQPREFLEKLRGFLRFAGDVDLPSLDTLSSTEWKALLLEYAERCEGLFRLVQCIRHGDSRHRFLAFQSRDVLSFEEDANIDVMHIVRTEEFHHLKLELDTLRPKQPLNNFMDAAAIVHLILLIQEFDRGDSDRLPLFFASSPLFDQAVRRAGVGRLLVSKRLAEAGSVLRNSEYFLLRAIFSARDFIKGRCRQDTLFERLRSILAAIIESRQSSKAIDEILLPEIESLLQEFRTFNLFDKVWLPAFAEENEEIMEELAAVVAHLDDQSVQHAIKQSIGVTERALAKGVRQYRLASLVWTGLQRAISALAIPGVMDHDLAQFGLSHTAKMQATELMSAFTEGGSLARSSMLSVIDMCLNESESAADPLQSALAVLWVLHLDRELLEVVQDRRALGAVLATPVLLMEAAALLRLEESSR